jgi:hypothetical protein
MASSLVPTPVTPKTTTAVKSPALGISKAKPCPTSVQENPGRRVSSTAASMVSMVKRPTFTTASRSMRS